MTKSELIQRLIKRNPHILQKDIIKTVDTVFENIALYLEEGNRVELRGFGIFYTKKRKKKIGRNPKTGNKVSVNEKLASLFKMSKKLQQLINNND